MEATIVHHIGIAINIGWDAETRRYIWRFSGPGVDPDNGNVTLPGPGKTAIVYTLDADSSSSYQLIYVNLDPESCATYEIECVQTCKEDNSLTVIDRNTNNNTGTILFCLRLVARM